MDVLLDWPKQAVAAKMKTKTEEEDEDIVERDIVERKSVAMCVR